MTELATGLRLRDIEGRLPALAEALAHDDVQLMCLFGSLLDRPVARDVDLAVLFRQYSFEAYLDTLETARQALDTQRVDLVVLNRSNPRLRLQALLDGRLLFAERPCTFADAVTEALSDYDDFRRFAAQYRRMLEQRLAEGLSVADRKMDTARVEGWLSKLDEALAELGRLCVRFASYEAFHLDVDTRELCVHFLRVALEAVLDICCHFLAATGVSLSEIDTTNLLELAGEKGLLEPNFAHRIRGMAGMRNAIVHVYWRLDYEAIYRALTGRLVDFDEFARQVRAQVDIDMGQPQP